LRAADQHLQHHCVFGHEAVTNVDVEVRKGRQQVPIVLFYGVSAEALLCPRDIVVFRLVRKGGHDTGQIMFVLEAYMLLDDPESGRDLLVLWSMCSSVHIAPTIPKIGICGLTPCG